MKINVEGCNIFRVFSVKNIRINSSMLCLECHLLNNKSFAQYQYFRTVSAKIGVSPPRVPVYRVTNYLPINSEETISWFVLDVFFWLFHTIKWFKLEINLHNIHIWSYFGQISVFDPLGRTYIYRVVLSNAQNRKVLWIIPIFAVIFGQNVKFWPPGVSPYRVTPHCYGIYLEEIWSCFVLNVYLWFLFITRWHK